MGSHKGICPPKALLALSVSITLFYCSSLLLLLFVLFFPLHISQIFEESNIGFHQQLFIPVYIMKIEL